MCEQERPKQSLPRFIPISREQIRRERPIFIVRAGHVTLWRHVPLARQRLTIASE